jgi:hypothetical protein
VPRRPGLAAACTAVHRPRFDRDAHSSRCGVKIAVARAEPSQSCSPDTAAAGQLSRAITTMALGFGPAPFHFACRYIESTDRTRTSQLSAFKWALTERAWRQRLNDISTPRA